MSLPYILDAVIEPVKQVVAALVENDQARLKQLIPNWNEVKEPVERVLSRYPYQIAAPPEIAFSAVEYVGETEQVIFPPGWELEYGMLHIAKNDGIQQWSVSCWLWTKEQGVSEVVLKLSVGPEGGQMRVLEFQDILVA